MYYTRSQHRELLSLSLNSRTMAPGTDNPQPPQVTLIPDTVSFPAFTGDGSESVHDFVRRVHDECTRRSVVSEDAKLAVIKSRISFEPTSLAGRLAKSDKFLQFTNLDDFAAELKKHFSGHSKLGATHSLLKVAQSATQVTRSVPDVFKAENFASSLAAELVTQLKGTNWFEDDKMTSEKFQRIMSYFLFILQLDHPTFAVASKVEFSPSDFIYDICKKILEKSPPATKPVHLAQVPHQQGPSHSPSSSPPLHAVNQGHARGRSSNRQFSSHQPSFRQSSSRQRSQSRYSRERNSTCHRCGLRGHIASFCRVSLDENGCSQFDPDAFCSLHNRRGHSLADCRLYKQQSVSRGSGSPSGNGSRRSQLEYT